jgi:sugar phosphate permease
MTSGFLGSSMSIGGAVSALLTGILLPLLDWRSLFVLFAIPGFIWSLCFYLWFRDTPDEMGVTSANTADPALRDLTPPLETSSPKLETPWLRLLQSPLMYFIGGQQFFRAAGYVFYASWFATFLQETRELPADQAARLTSMPLWAVVIGSPLGGILSDWFFARTGSKRVARSGIAAASMFACALLIALAYLVNNVLGAILLISVGSFCSSLGGPCAYATTIDVGGNHVGTVFSVMNMCGNVGAAVFPMIVPLLVAAAGTWDIVFLFFAGIYVAAGLCWLLVNPNVIIFANRSDDDQS